MAMAAATRPDAGAVYTPPQGLEVFWDCLDAKQKRQLLTIDKVRACGARACAHARRAAPSSPSPPAGVEALLGAPTHAPPSICCAPSPRYARQSEVLGDVFTCGRCLKRLNKVLSHFEAGESRAPCIASASAALMPAARRQAAALPGRAWLFRATQRA